MPTRIIVLDRQAVAARVDAVRRAARQDGEMTKTEFAATLGIQPPNYSKVLKGTAFLTADQLYALWRLYGADPRYIMEGVEIGLPTDLLERIRKLT